MSLLVKTNLETMDYSFQAQPFVDVVGGNTIVINGMDYSWMAQPFVRNNIFAANYSRGNYASLPSGVTDLENIYTEQEMTDIVDDNSVRITQDATSEYAIHQYKNDVGTYPSGIFRWNGQSSLAPSSSPVVLQVYKVNGTTWETKDTKSTGDADTDFDLSFSLADLTDYKDGDGIVTCRVYQQNV